MPTAKGFKQINFQIPDGAFEKMTKECEERSMKISEFCTRMVTLYFLAKELGFSHDVMDFFIKKH